MSRSVESRCIMSRYSLLCYVHNSKRFADPAEALEQRRDREKSFGKSREIIRTHLTTMPKPCENHTKTVRKPNEHATKPCLNRATTSRKPREIQVKSCSRNGCKKASHNSGFLSIWGSFWTAQNPPKFKALALGPSTPHCGFLFWRNSD